jgi:hypothetical protein
MFQTTNQISLLPHITLQRGKTSYRHRVDNLGKFQLTVQNWKIPQRIAIGPISLASQVVKICPSLFRGVLPSAKI